MTETDEPRVKYQRGHRTLLPQIRRLLRAQSVMAREDMREQLRERGHIGRDGFGGRRLYDALHWLEDCGEVVLTPTTVTAVNLAQIRPQREKRTPSILAVRRALAEKRREITDRRARGEISRARQDAS